MTIVGLLVVPFSLWSQDAPKKPAAEKITTAKPDAAKAADAYTARLFLVNPDGSDLKQLTVFPEYTSQGSPEYSADGKVICFDAWKTGETVNTGKIALVNSDGTKPRIIGEGVMPSLSPGGKRIAFSRNSPNRGVWIMSVDGPEAELVLIDANGWGTSWSRDGRLAFTTSAPEVANIAILDIVEGIRESVFDDDTSPYQQIYWNLTWSPDSKRIAFKGVTRDGKKELAVVDARGEKFGFVRVPGSEGYRESLAWSSDGTLLYITKPCPERDNRQQLYSLNPDKPDSLQLLQKQDPQRPSVMGSTSPDGKRLVITCLPPVPAKEPAK